MSDNTTCCDRNDNQDWINLMVMIQMKIAVITQTEPDETAQLQECTIADDNAAISFN